jgi:alpha-amylase/alpha-mannosidase (GH57 family)
MIAARYVCVHGHFYQPPRENPWLEVIDPQPSAAPYPDWNARITAECYRPNAAARIVDGRGQIVRIVDNYERMSFDVGPTLMAWLEREAADVHRALVDADRKSRARFGGHGSAMAQAYNHIILPLASARDRATQVRWGVRDFEHRFGRAPEGMWLPECAVDTPSLEALAAEGITFTVLAPHQARRWRPFGGAWKTGEPGAIDTGRTYRCNLPSGRSIDLFFYDGPAAREIAFDGLLRDGGALVDRLLANGRTAEHGEPFLAHVATDGETYGHHHRYGDMALAYALSLIDRGDPRAKGARLTNYAEYRALAPATWEVEIAEHTSWSCAHGVERWRSDCGCHTGGGPGWNQAWRAPLRRALDGLAARAAEVVEQGAREAITDPWAARDAYVDVVLDRSPAAVDRFLERFAPGVSGDAQVARVLELMELARNAMLMYTSCGWFFDDLAGIEPVQILQYAARACELAERIAGPGVEAELVDALARARSNDPDQGDGRDLWKRRVAPARVDLAHVAAHHAVATVIAGNGDDDAPAVRGSHVVCFDVELRERALRRAGKARLLAARVGVTSIVTRERAELGCAVLHLGEHHLSGGVRPFGGDAAWADVARELLAAFGGGDLFAVERTIGAAFAGHTFTLGTLFPGEQSGALARLLADPIAAAETRLAGVYDEHAPLMRYLASHGLPVPEVLRAAAEVTLRRRLLAALGAPTPNASAVRACIGEAGQVEVDLDTPEIAYAAGLALARVMDALAAEPEDAETLGAVARLAAVAARMKSEVDLWHAQNATFTLVERHLAAWRSAAATGDDRAARAAEELVRLAAAVRIAVP